MRASDREMACVRSFVMNMRLMHSVPWNERPRWLFSITKQQRTFDKTGQCRSWRQSVSRNLLPNYFGPITDLRR